MKGYRVEFRCAEGAGEAVESWAEAQKISRSEAWRRVMSAGLASLAGKPSPAVIQTASSPASVRRSEDEVELRQWRAFADRTAIHGDPTRQVTPAIEMSGWTFVVIPQRDEHLEIA